MSTYLQKKRLKHLFSASQMQALVIVQPNRMSFWSAATRRRMGRKAATSRLTPR